MRIIIRKSGSSRVHFEGYPQHNNCNNNIWCNLPVKKVYKTYYITILYLSHDTVKNVKGDLLLRKRICQAFQTSFIIIIILFFIFIVHCITLYYYCKVHWVGRSRLKTLHNNSNKKLLYFPRILEKKCFCAVIIDVFFTLFPQKTKHFSSFLLNWNFVWWKMEWK